ncbi:MAG: hypothetical protein ACREXU_18855 [Gammaproteobacteria bacterium]
MLLYTYPFSKRYTYLPQVRLGMAFGWAVPMAFSCDGDGSAPSAVRDVLEWIRVDGGVPYGPDGGSFGPRLDSGAPAWAGPCLMGVPRGASIR